MDATSPVHRLTLLTILLVVVLSGPLVGVVDLTEEPSSGLDVASANGDATVEVVSVPAGSIVIERDGFGADLYRLESPPAKLRVLSTTGQPVVVYGLEIPSLGFSSVKRLYLDESSTGLVEMSLVESRFKPDKIRADSYEAHLTIAVLGDERRTIYERNVTVEVEG